MDCDVCRLPDPYNGTGDGIGSCDCPRCDGGCGVAANSVLCECPGDDDYPWVYDQEEADPDPDPDKIVGWTDDDMFNDHPGIPAPPDPGPDPYGEPDTTTVHLPEDR